MGYTYNINNISAATYLSKTTKIGTKNKAFYSVVKYANCLICIICILMAIDKTFKIRENQQNIDKLISSHIGIVACFISPVILFDKSIHPMVLCEYYLI